MDQFQHEKYNEIMPITEEISYAKRAFSTLFMLLALAGLGVLGWFAYEESVGPVSDKEVPLIKAETTPFKIEPEDPGGMDIPHKDKVVYNAISPTISDAAEENGTAPAKTMPLPEEPVDMQKLASVPMPVILDKNKELEKKKEAAQQTMEEKMADLMKQVEDQPKTEEEVEITETVKEIKAEEKPAEKIEELKIVEVEKKVEEKPELNVVKVPNKEEETIELEDGKIIFKPSYKAEEKAKTEVAVKVKEKPKLKAEKKPASPSKYRAQLGSYKSTEDLRLGWLELHKKYPDIIGDLRYSIEPVDLGGKGMFYRLQVGPFEKESEASELCRKLTAENQGCFVAR